MRLSHAYKTYIKTNKYKSVNRPEMCNIWPEFTSYSDRKEYTQIRYLTIGKTEIIQGKLPKLAHTLQKTVLLHYKDKPISAVKGNNPFFFLDYKQHRNTSYGKLKSFQFETSGDINS